MKVFLCFRFFGVSNIVGHLISKVVYSSNIFSLIITCDVYNFFLFLVFIDSSFSNSYFYSDNPILCYRCTIMVINILSECLKRYSSFTELFCSCDISSSKPSSYLNLYSLRSFFHYFLDNSLTNSSERHSAFYLRRCKFSHNLRRQLRNPHFFENYFEIF